MSGNNAGSTELTLEQVQKELSVLKSAATNMKTSPVAIFMPIVSNFDWVPVTEDDPETSTIVLASHYGEIDNGCIIYNPAFVHKLYKEGDYGTFYAIIATIGLGVKCGYYSFRNGEGIPHSVAVKIMLAHSGIFNTIMGSNPEFNQAIAALQQVYECEDIKQVFMQKYAELNTVAVDGPTDENGNPPTESKQFDDDPNNWNLETVRKYIELSLMSAPNMTMPQALPGVMTQQQQSAQQQNQQQQAPQQSKWGAVAQPQQKNNQNNNQQQSGQQSGQQGAEQKTPRQIAQQAKKSARHAQNCAEECAEECGNSSEAQNALSEMEEATSEMMEAAREYENAAKDGDQPKMESAAQKMQQASQKMQQASQHMQQAMRDEGVSNESAEEMQQASSSAQQAASSAKSNGQQGSQQQAGQQGGESGGQQVEQQGSSQNASEVSKQAQSASNAAKQGAATCSQACGNTPEAQAAQKQVEQGAINLEQGAKRYEAGVKNRNTAQQQLGAQQMAKGAQQMNSGAQQMQQAMQSSGAQGSSQAQQALQQMQEGAQNASSLSNEAQSASNEAAASQPTDGQSVQKQSSQSAQNARESAKQCAHACGNSQAAQQAQQTIEQGAQQLEQGAAQYAQGCENGNHQQMQQGAQQMQQGTNTIKKGTQQMHTALKQSMQNGLQDGQKGEDQGEDQGVHQDGSKGGKQGEKTGGQQGGDQGEDQGEGQGGTQGNKKVGNQGGNQGEDQDESDGSDMPDGGFQSPKSNGGMQGGQKGGLKGMRTGLSKLQEAAQEAQQAATNGSRGTENGGTYSGKSSGNHGQNPTVEGGENTSVSEDSDENEPYEGPQSKGGSTPKLGDDSQASNGSTSGGSSIGNLAGAKVNLTGKDKPIKGLNSNLAQFANETTTFSHVKGGLSKTGHSIKEVLGETTRDINNNIKRKSQVSSEGEQQKLQELNEISSQKNKGDYVIDTDTDLRVAAEILSAAKAAQMASNNDGDDRDWHHPTIHHFDNGSFNMLEEHQPKVLIAIDASGSMWFPKSLLVGAANLLSSLAKQLESAGVIGVDYVFWDDTCDIPQPYSTSMAQSLAEGNKPSVQSYENTGVLQSSVGGGGTNIYSLVARLSRYNEDGEPMYDDDNIEKFNLKFADGYDLIIIYSDFVFDYHKIPNMEDDIIERFGDIRMNKLCCVCCNERGERETPSEFKELVRKWISYEDWKHDIDIYRCQPFDSDE